MTSYLLGLKRKLARMGHALAQFIIPGDSGLNEDKYVNTFHFETAGGTVGATEIADINTELTSFYNSIHSPGVSSIAARLSDHINPAGCQIKIYDMGDPEPRTPISTTTVALTLGGTTSCFPSEVALCLSYKAAPVSGVPAAWLRGRIYVGPFVAAAGDDTAAENRPTTPTLNALAGAGSYLAGTSSSVSWAVFSKALKASGDPTGLSSITNGFVDNAWDTQRRRGAAPSARTLWT